MSTVTPPGVGGNLLDSSEDAICESFREIDRIVAEIIARMARLRTLERGLYE